jgi:hypothetical protein
MKLQLFFAATLLLVSCGGNDGRTRTIQPLTLSGQINNYSGGIKYIQGGNVENQPFIGEINTLGQFSVTIPTNTGFFPDILIAFDVCKNPNDTSTISPLNFSAIPLYLRVFPSKTSPYSELEGTMYQSTCDSKGGCTLPTENFRVRNIYVSEPKNIKNYSCTIPYAYTGKLDTTYNFNLSLIPGWNTIRFVQKNITATTQTLDVENYSGLVAGWNISSPTIETPASQRP